jgi:hypothetical protein
METHKQNNSFALIKENGENLGLGAVMGHKLLTSPLQLSVILFTSVSRA